MKNEKMKTEFEIVELSDFDLEAVNGGLELKGTDGSTLSVASIRDVTLGLKGTDGSTLSVTSTPGV